MKIKEIAETRPEDLIKRLAELELELMKLNAQKSTGTALKSPGQIKKIKKTVARIKTVLKLKEDEIRA
ncbi:50S ribosomal protein L29 [Candidatus Woesearchaeota archaeon]|nr:50S ribosomal protein L29 [Candidatus Woesearchaeota archaeon]